MNPEAPGGDSADRERVHLPIAGAADPSTRKSSLRRDGTRVFVHPADVTGRFHKARRLIFALLIGVWIALPMWKIKGHPALFLDITHRTFFMFGATFNAQDAWLLFFLLTGVAFGLAFLTAFFGRVWCGYACPQTVFLDGLFRVVERWIDGPATTRSRLDAAPWDAGKLLRRLAKHACYLALSFALAHMFLAYFVTFPGLFRMMRGSPGAHPEAFGWAVAVTLLLYGNFAFFREQLCLFVCPYGRLQSVLIDAHTVNVYYDSTRGEPRGKAKDASAGACVDCFRCVAVCPTGIDIRDGLQLDCIACSACVDACDEVMDKLDRPRGLVRYASQEELRGGTTRWLRPRAYVYFALGIAGICASTLSASRHTEFEANVLRPRGASFVVDRVATVPVVRNSFEVHLVNKDSFARTFDLTAPSTPDVTFALPMARVTLPPGESLSVPLIVTTPLSAFHGARTLTLAITPEDRVSERREVSLTLLGPL
ncbi:MAG: cytochrome c oxidase accessory protein CcoG [Polyangiales bacterium]